MLGVYKRYESPELIGWKKLSSEEQIKKVNEVSEPYFEKLQVVSVDNQSIEIELFMSKEDVYDFLVEYENHVRNALGNFPIIVLLNDRADENTKRRIKVKSK